MLVPGREIQLLLIYCQENLFVKSLYIYIYIYICNYISSKIETFSCLFILAIFRRISGIFVVFQIFNAFIPRFLTEPLKVFRGTLVGTRLCRMRVALEGRSALMAICAEIMNCSGREERKRNT